MAAHFNLAADTRDDPDLQVSAFDNDTRAPGSVVSALLATTEGTVSLTMTRQQALTLANVIMGWMSEHPKGLSLQEAIERG